MTPYPKRLIEVDLPIKHISAHARREESIRHGHISTPHIWWARRPLAACRAVTCAALWPYPAFGFLDWNLFLAWLPLFFAWVAVFVRRPRPARWAAGLWLLFLPNAPYILTDFIHLRRGGPVPLWFDTLMLLTFAVTGLLVGFVSVALMQALVRARYGGRVGWLFTLAALALSGYGVFVGRFLRWNSWDLLARPDALLQDLLATWLEPAVMKQTLAVSLLFTLLLTVTYAILFTLPRLATTQIEGVRPATQRSAASRSRASAQMVSSSFKGGSGGRAYSIIRRYGPLR